MSVKTLDTVKQPSGYHPPRHDKLLHGRSAFLFLARFAVVGGRIGNESQHKIIMRGTSFVHM